MANRLHLLRRTFLGASALLVLGTVGCAFPHGSTSGDPLLGSFNRPIVPTPPPERGGLGLDSPAYDAGSRIGMLSPDVPTPIENSSGFMTLPQLSSPSVFSGARMPFGTPDDSSLTRRTPTGTGAKLPSLDNSARTPTAPAYRPLAPRDPVNSITSAASFSPSETGSPIKQASFEMPHVPSEMKSVEDGNAMLQDLGAKGQRMEQLSSGDWLIACMVGSKVYETRGENQMEAMKKLVEQVQKSR